MNFLRGLNAPFNLSGVISIEKEFKVTKENFYERLDRVLRKELSDLKLSSIYKLLRRGNVRVNGNKIRDGSWKMEIGDKIQVVFSGDPSKLKRLEESRELTPKHIPLDILFEDDLIVAVDKPSGISVHPGKGIQIITLVEGLMAYGNSKGFVPRPVHRLDKHTSGVILFAKSPEAARELSKLFRERGVEKGYFTLVKGFPEKRGKLVSQREKFVESLAFTVEKSYATTSLLWIDLFTGKKHQIRRQLSEAGYPVVGDDVYGDRLFNRDFKKETGLRRYFLHCSRLSFARNDGKEIEIISELPGDLKRVLGCLE